ncbi:MAG: SagB family peptide dehydrogenase [Vicinamibacterales bacterium]
MRSGRRVNFRRSPHLVSYWSSRGLTLVNYATGRRAGGAPLVHDILGIFDRWRPIEELCQALPRTPRPALARVVNALVRLTFLQRSDRPPDSAEAALTAWRGWNPAAAFFHCTTKDVPYSTDLEASGRRMRAVARREPMPPPIKRYRHAPRIGLPAPPTEPEFPRVLLARRTWRDFSTRPASLESLGALLGLTFRVQRWVDLPGIGRTALKTSPSGGARHPIECYVLALRVDGLPRGLYHYRADRHKLERLSTGATAHQVTRYLPGQSWYGGASALVLLTAVFARTQWRYPFARAYRVVLAEAGHLCQTFCLTASWLGLAPFCSMALGDSAIERDLGIDGVSESVIYAAGFGMRPAGVDWAPWPRRRRRSRASTSGASSGSARSQRRRNSS